MSAILTWTKDKNQLAEEGVGAIILIKEQKLSCSCAKAGLD
jgi:hypothetical protein